MTVRSRLFLVVLSFAASVGVACAQTPVPKATAESPRWDFGRVESGAALDHTFVIKNAGNAPLHLGEIRLRGKGLSARLPQTIAPGESGEIAAKIDTGRLVGDWRWQIVFQTNDLHRPTVAFDLAAHVFLPLEVDPLQVYFSLYDDQSETKTVAILNHRQRPLAIERVEASGGHFTTALETVKPGHEYRLSVTVPRSVPPGRYREAAILRTDDPKRPKLEVPVNVFVKRDIYVFPDSVDFGQVSARQVKERPAVRELQSQTLLVKKRAGDFAITGIDTAIPFLTVGKTPEGRAKTFRLDVGLAPDKIVTGRIAGTIRIKTDDPRFPEIAVPVTGEIR